jgi:hypothetical protein
LAYRALNELLLAVVCFNPEDEPELQAVWDDFLMCKVLPGIDGDSDKLALPSDEVLTEHTLLAELAKRLKEQLHLIWDSPRIELLLFNLIKYPTPTKWEASLSETACCGVVY